MAQAVDGEGTPISSNLAENIPAANAPDSGFINQLTGILSKGVDTYDAYISTKAKIGTTYPTGQVNPTIVAAQPKNYTPYYIGGAIVVVLVLFLALKK